MRSPITWLLIAGLLIGGWFFFSPNDNDSPSDDAVGEKKNASDAEPPVDPSLNILTLDSTHPPEALADEAVDRLIRAILSHRTKASTVAMIGKAEPEVLRLSYDFWREHCSDFQTLLMKGGPIIHRDSPGALSLTPTPGMSLFLYGKNPITGQTGSSALEYVWDSARKIWRRRSPAAALPKPWLEQLPQGRLTSTVYPPFELKDYKGQWPIIQGEASMGWKSAAAPKVSKEQVAHQVDLFLNNPLQSRIFALGSVDAYLLGELLSCWRGEKPLYANSMRVAADQGIVLRYGARTERIEQYTVDSKGFRHVKKWSVKEMLAPPDRPQSANEKWNPGWAWLNKICHETSRFGKRTIPAVYAKKSQRLWFSYTPLQRKDGVVSLDSRATWPITLTMWDGSKYELLPDGQAVLLGVANYSWNHFWSSTNATGRQERINVMAIFMDFQIRSPEIAYEALYFKRMPFPGNDPFVTYVAACRDPQSLIPPFGLEPKE